MTSAYAKEVPLVTISVNSLEKDLQASRKLVRVRGSTKTIARMIDYNALSEQEHFLVDEGDLLPSWGYWWLTLAAKLSYDALWANSSALIIYSSEFGSQNSLVNLFDWKKSSYKVIPLMIEDMCEALTVRSFIAGFILAWGVNSTYLNNPMLPISCRGAILPIVDGMGVLCIATDEDTNFLSNWIGNEERR